LLCNAKGAGQQALPPTHLPLSLSLSLSPPHVMSLTKANKYRTGRILQEQIK